MKIIEKIEIRHFRSFDGGAGQEKVEINDLKDLNIFSGVNDSGKSNILRALNLFFNNEILPGLSFDIERDLSKTLKQRSDDKFSEDRANKKEARQRDLFVKIKISFLNKREKKGVLPERFWVEKTWHKTGEKQVKSSVDKLDNPQASRILTQFLNQIQFEYIPAVKDRQFFNILFKKLQNYLFEKQKSSDENKFQSHSNDFNNLLKSETIKLFEEFKQSTGIDAGFNVPNTLIDFFRTLSVETERGISLFDRGDGMQARFIPDILNEISRDTRKKVIWGFEEPENSYEPLRCFQLAQDFVQFSTKKQIFITSHAFPFIALRGDGISSYRVKNINNASAVGRVNWNQRTIRGPGFENNTDLLEQEIGILETYKKLSDHLGLELEKPYIYVEGESDVVYLKKAWSILCPQENIAFEIVDKGGSRIINSIEDESKGSSNKKIVAIFDNDKTGNNYFELKTNDIKKLFNQDQKDPLVKKHKNKDIYVMLLPPPKSRQSWANPNHSKILEMEHFFEDTFIVSLGIKIPTTLTQTAKEWTPSDSFKRSLRENIEQLEIAEVNKNDFENFKPLFKKILTCLQLNIPTALS